MKRFIGLTSYFLVFAIVSGVLIRSDVKSAAQEQLPVNETQQTSDTAHQADLQNFPYALEPVELSAAENNSSATEFADERAIVLEAGDSFECTFEIAENSTYTLGMYYCPVDSIGRPIEVSISIDDKFQFPDMQKLAFPKLWENASEPRVDGLGNEFAPEQALKSGYTLQFAADTTGRNLYPYTVSLEKGTHVLKVTALDAPFALSKVVLGVVETVSDYNTVIEQQQKAGVTSYQGDQIEIKGQSAYIKSTNFLIPLSDNSEPTLLPASATKSKINYIGGPNWSKPGETLTWKVDVKESGWYKMGFHYRQNYILNGNSYRWLKIDGKTPFSEAEGIKFNYTTGWDFAVFGGEKPYLIYLSAGVHDISLSVTMHELAGVAAKLEKIVSELGDLYLDITMITGEVVDTYRDYELFNQIPNFNEILERNIKALDSVIADMEKIYTKKSGSNIYIMRNMRLVLQNMLDNPYFAHRYKQNFYDTFCSLSASIYEMSTMPLDIGRIFFATPDKEFETPAANFFDRVVFTTQRFLASFIEDYTSISGDGEESEKITLWVNWGRDQAQVLSSLIKERFEPKNHINVDVKLTNASLIQAILSGNGPDCVLQQSRTTPVNLAMRGALYDLTNFDDFETVTARFMKNATVPYWYKDGCYALPDTQNFFMLFYRTDIFENLGLKVPETWDDFIKVSKVLQRNNLQCYLPYTQITDMYTIDVGVGGLTLFPTLLLQNGKSLYTDDLSKTTFYDTDTIEVFAFWSDFYTKRKFPITMDFYNRFRLGTAPMGIQAYTLYTTFKVAAPEIDGRWAVAQIPGVKDADGNINRAVAGSGSGCSILELSANKQAAWKFLKWWTSADTQVAYSNNLESILGTVGRHPTSNVEAFKQLPWDKSSLNQMLEQWEQVQELPEIPGGYYVARGIDQAYWNIINANANPTDMLLKWGQIVNTEIERKRVQYAVGN